MNRAGFHILAEKGAMYCLASGLKTVLHHFRDTQSESDYELVKTNSVLMGAPLDGAQVDALLLHLPLRLHFRGKMKVVSGLRMKKNCSCH